MNDDECYDDFARGGPVEPHAEHQLVLSQMGDYIIPIEFARKWGQELLDSINKDGVE